MPRYLLETIGDGRVDEVVLFTARRFPEVVIERRTFPADGVGPRWLVEAPSEAHVRRWALAAQLAVREVQLMVATRRWINDTKEHLG
ncbi:MAG: hypothetical protein ACRDZU_05470 [Acidimicrobiales bacterium]